MKNDEEPLSQSASFLTNLFIGNKVIREGNFIARVDKTTLSKGPILIVKFPLNVDTHRKNKFLAKAQKYFKDNLYGIDRNGLYKKIRAIKKYDSGKLLKRKALKRVRGLTCKVMHEDLMGTSIKYLNSRISKIKKMDDEKRYVLKVNKKDPKVDLIIKEYFYRIAGIGISSAYIHKNAYKKY